MSIEISLCNVVSVLVWGVCIKSNFTKQKLMITAHVCSVVFSHLVSSME